MSAVKLVYMASKAISHLSQESASYALQAISQTSTPYPETQALSCTYHDWSNPSWCISRRLDLFLIWKCLIQYHNHRMDCTLSSRSSCLVIFQPSHNIYLCLFHILALVFGRFWWREGGEQRIFRIWLGFHIGGWCPRWVDWLRLGRSWWPSLSAVAVSLCNVCTTQS